jgi:putative membrane protein
MKILYGYLLALLALLIWSGINPKEQFTWFLEVLPAIIGVAVLIFTFKNFRFTGFVYALIFIHCAILIIGGHYTYAEVPLFDWIKETFNQSRNNYDKLGHFAQGFVPLFIVRELFIRKHIVNGKKWLSFIAVCIVMAISVSYEFIEWLVSVLTAEGGDAFLGTQGYIWDTQSDMLFATIGAITGLLIFRKIHDKAIKHYTLDAGNRT